MLTSAPGSPTTVADRARHPAGGDGQHRGDHHRAVGVLARRMMFERQARALGGVGLADRADEQSIRFSGGHHAESPTSFTNTPDAE